MPKRRILEKPSKHRQKEFLAAVARSRQLHDSWASPPRTAAAFSRYLAHLQQPQHVGYWILTETNELAGVINITEIVRGNFRSAYLGYYAFVPHNRHGYLTEGLSAAISDAFRRLRLHRLEANVQPDNDASTRLVQRLGFRKEGFSQRYLKIAGRWRDHERWAITAEEWSSHKRIQRRHEWSYER
ncbi:MAG TPA: GNAT family N-acetyltransferase [Terriglobia bacterium]|nr:GNAT family N-acetyltransferase [Terriglobia bacterium]